MLTFSYKSWRLYRGTATSLTSYYAPYCFLLGLGMLLGSLPLLFTDSPAAMRHWYLAGQAVTWISLLWQAQIDWFLMLRPRWSRWILILPTAAAGAFIWLNQLGATQPRHDGKLIVWGNPYAACVGAVIILSILLLPIIVFYVRQAFALANAWSRRRALSIAFMALAIYAGEIYIYLVLRGNEPVGLSLFDCVVFGVFFLTMLIPRPTAAVGQSA